MAELDRLLPVLDEVVALRPMLRTRCRRVTGRPATPLGGVPEFKAAQARLDELLTEESGEQTGAVLKGVAPLLVDFPSELDGSDGCSAGWRATGPSGGTTGSTSASPVAGRCGQDMGNRSAAATGRHATYAPPAPTTA